MFTGEITKPLIVERDTLHSYSLIDLHLHELNTQICHNIADSNRQKCSNAVESCSHECNPSRLWGIIKSLNGKRAETPPNQPMIFSSKSLTPNGEIAFSKHFTSPVPHSNDPSAWIVKRKLLKECLCDKSVSRFSPDIVSQAEIFLPLEQIATPYIT